jgi:hypothetical protein
VDSILRSWEGELTYLDYGDNATLVTLPAWLLVQRSDDGASLELSFLFEEPDGSTVEGGERFFETPDGLFFGDLWQVESREVQASDGSHRLVLRREGLDDERPATLLTTVEQAGDRLTVTRTVRYGPDSERFQRNRFEFRRVREQLVE